MLKKLMLSSLIGFLAVFTILTQSSYAQFGPDGSFPPEDEIGGPPTQQMQEGPKGRFHKRHGKHHGKKMGHRGGPGGMMRMLKQLDLSEEQKEQLKTHHENAKEEIKGLREQLKSSRMSLMETLMDPDSSKEQMLAKLDAFSQIKTKTEKVRIENLAYMKSILTKEQKAKLKTLVAEKKSQIEERIKKFKEMRQQRKNRISRESEE